MLALGGFMSHYLKNNNKKTQILDSREKNKNKLTMPNEQNSESLNIQVQTDSTFCNEVSKYNKAALSPHRKELQPQQAPERFHENY